MSFFEFVEMDDPELSGVLDVLHKPNARLVLDVFCGDLRADVSDETILDIGCGQGYVTSEILSPMFPKCKRTIGTENSHKCINYAAKTFIKKGKEDIRYVALNPLDGAEIQQKLINTWGRFTKIFSLYYLYWIADHKKFLQNVNHLLQEGGDCLLAFVAQCPFSKVHEMMANEVQWAQNMEDVEFHVPITQHSSNPIEDFSRKMEEAELEVKTCTILGCKYTFDTVEKLKGCIRIANPFINCIPEEQVNEYVDQCVNKIRAFECEDYRKVKKEGGVYPYKLLVAHGRKKIHSE